jgi:hypothetical protein
MFKVKRVKQAGAFDGTWKFALINQPVADMRPFSKSNFGANFGNMGPVRFAPHPAPAHHLHAHFCDRPF